MKSETESFYKIKLKKDMLTVQLEKENAKANRVLETKSLFSSDEIHTLEIKGPGILSELHFNVSGPNLKKLCIQDLQIIKIVSTPNIFSQLTTFNGKNMNLTNIDNLFEALPSGLKFLQLKSCKLDANCFMALSKFANTLESLDLSDNQIKELPKDLQLFSNLRRLNLDGNQLTHLPISLKTIPKLGHLSLDGNKFNENVKAEIQRIFNIWF